MLLLDFVELPLFPFPPPGAAPSTPEAVEAVTVALKAAGAAAVEEVSFTLEPAPAGAAIGGAEGVDVEEGVGDTDLALDGIKGTEAGFKFDLMLLLDDAIAEVAVEDLDEAEGIGLSFSLCNAWVAAECLAA